MTFNVGDKVRLVTRDAWNGRVGTIVETDRKARGMGYDYLVELSGVATEFAPLEADEMQKVED